MGPVIGQPRPGDLVVALVPQDGSWDVGHARYWHPWYAAELDAPVYAVRHPTPEELAAYQLAQGEA